METTRIDKSRQVLASDYLQLPGLVMLGHNKASRASEPLKMHQHPGLIECVAVMRGHECYAVEKKQYNLSGGDVFITPAGLSHGNGGDIQGVCEIFWFQINPLAEDLLGLSEDRTRAYREKLDVQQPGMLHADQEGMELLKRCFQNFITREISARQYAQSLFISFLTRLLFLQQKRLSADEQINQVLSLIEQSLQTSVSLDTISAQCGMSLSGLKHKFRDYTGKTPRDYINQQKIKLACENLRAGVSVTDTAMSLGFSSSSYFAAVFRKYMNCTPTQYASRQKPDSKTRKWL